MIAASTVTVPYQRDPLVRIAERAAVHQQVIALLFDAAPAACSQENREAFIEPDTLVGNQGRNSDGFQAFRHLLCERTLPRNSWLAVDHRQFSRTHLSLIWSGFGSPWKIVMGLRASFLSFPYLYEPATESGIRLMFGQSSFVIAFWSP